MWHVGDYFQIEVSPAGLLGEDLCTRHSSGTLSRCQLRGKAAVAEFAGVGCYYCHYFVSGAVLLLQQSRTKP